MSGNMLRICLVLVIATARLAPAQSIDAFFKETFEQMLRTNPDFATSIGRHEYDDRWTDLSKEARARQKDFSQTG